MDGRTGVKAGDGEGGSGIELGWGIWEEESGGVLTGDFGMGEVRVVFDGWE